MAASSGGGGVKVDPSDFHEENQRATRWPDAGIFTLLLGVLVFACFPDVLLGIKTFFYRDYAIFGYPLAAYHRESFWRGEIPQWNPYNDFGLPFLAQWNTLAVYPLSFIYLLLPMPWALSAFCLAHFFLAGLGAYFLARQWTGQATAAAVCGTAFVFNGLALSCLKWPNNIAAWALIPWVVLAVEFAWQQGGRWLLMAAWVGAIQMLSGAPELILFTWMILLGLWAAQASGRRVSPKTFGRFAGMVVLVAGLSAIQLLPFLALLRASQRVESMGPSYWSMPPWGWANLVLPLFRSVPSHEGVYAQYQQYWISSYYPGIGALLLAVSGLLAGGRRRVLFLGIVTAAGLLLAFGENGLIYSIQFLPIATWMRFPIKFVALAQFGLVALAGYGWLSWEQQTIRMTRRQWLVISAAWLGLLWIIVAIGCANPLPLEQFSAAAQKRALLENGVRQTVFLLLFLSTLWLIRFNRGRRTARFLRVAFCVLLAFDGFTHARLNPLVEPWVLHHSSKELPVLNLEPKPAPAHGRAFLRGEAETTLDHLMFTNSIEDVLYSRKSLFADINLIDRVPKADGFFSLYLRPQAAIQSILYNNRHVEFPRLLDFLSISHSTAPGRLIDWELRQSYYPVITGGQKPIFATKDETIRGLTAPEFDSAKTVFLPREIDAAVDVTNAARVVIQPPRFSEHHIDFTIQADQPAIVVVAQTFYSAWKARLDGRSIPIWQANLAFQAIQVPPGKHQIQFIYRDPAFLIGSSLSALFLLGTMVSFAFSRR